MGDFFALCQKNLVLPLPAHRQRWGGVCGRGAGDVWPMRTLLPSPAWPLGTPRRHPKCVELLPSSPDANSPSLHFPTTGVKGHVAPEAPRPQDSLTCLSKDLIFSDFWVRDLQLWFRKTFRIPSQDLQHGGEFRVLAGREPAVPGCLPRAACRRGPGGPCLALRRSGEAAASANPPSSRAGGRSVPETLVGWGSGGAVLGPAVPAPEEGRCRGPCWSLSCLTPSVLPR